MIKNEVVLEYLYKLKNDCELTTPMGARNNYFNSLEVGIFNTIKQIPKKVVIKDNTYLCPFCDSIIIPYSKYCCNCGQAVDWSKN